MSRFLSSFYILTLALLVLSCSKEFEQRSNDVKFILKSSSPSTKTYIEEDSNDQGTYYPYWHKGDVLGCLFNLPTTQTTSVDLLLSNKSNNGETASFEGTTSYTEKGGYIYPVYPNSAIKGFGNGSISLQVPSEQFPTITSFDPSADILVGRQCYFMVEDGEVLVDDLYFKRIMSVLRVNLSNSDASGEEVEYVSVSVNGTNRLSGKAEVDIENASISSWIESSNSVTAKYTTSKIKVGTTATNSAYLMVAPGVIPSGSILTFTIKTSSHLICKDVTLPSDLKFPVGDIVTINLTTDSSHFVYDYSGDYIIIATDGSNGYYAMRSYLSGENNVKGTLVSFSDSKVSSEDDLSSFKKTITKVDNLRNYYTIKDDGGYYLYAASSSSNQIKGKTDIGDDMNACWHITKTNDVWSVVADKSTNRNILRYNYNTGSPIFSCYESEKMNPVILIPWSDVVINEGGDDDSDPLPSGNYTVSWTASTNSLGSQISSVNGSVSGKLSTKSSDSQYSFEWSYKRTLTALTKESKDYVQMTGEYMQLGSSKASEDIAFTTSNIPGVVNSIVIDCASKASTHVLSVSVGSDTYALSPTTVPAPVNNSKGTFESGGEVTASGDSSGAISISFSGNKTKVPLYIKSITVNFTIE